MLRCEICVGYGLWVTYDVCRCAIVCFVNLFGWFCFYTPYTSSKRSVGQKRPVVKATLCAFAFTLVQLQEVQKAVTLWVTRRGRGKAEGHGHVQSGGGG